MTYEQILRDAALQLEHSRDIDPTWAKREDGSKIESANFPAYLRALADEFELVTAEDAEALEDELERLHGPKMDGPRTPLEGALLQARQLITFITVPTSQAQSYDR